MPCGFLLGRPGHDELPGIGIGQFRKQFCPADPGKKQFQVPCEPLPVGRFDGQYSGVRLAESPVRAPEKHLAAHHADQGPVSQDIAGVLGIDATDDGNAAGHEFSEIISDRSQNPELRGRKPRVLLGHGHAARSDIAADKDLALGHGVAGAVSRMAVDHDLGAGIQPAHIIGNRALHLDHGVRKSQ